RSFRFHAGEYFATGWGGPRLDPKTLAPPQAPSSSGHGGKTGSDWSTSPASPSYANVASGTTHPSPQAASIRTYLDPEPRVRLPRVLAPYGPEIVEQTLQATTMTQLRKIARGVKDSVERLGTRELGALIEVKESLTWGVKTGKKEWRGRYPHGTLEWVEYP